MSKYTTEVRFICETYAGYDESQDYDKIDEIIENSRQKIFSNYPIFDEEYRQTLESKILKHYYTREIGSETVALWKFRLNTKMNEIMPFYNQLYKSELIKFDPLGDYDITIEHTGKENKNTIEQATHGTENVQNENEIKNNTEQKTHTEYSDNRRNKNNNTNENIVTENKESEYETGNITSNNTENSSISGTAKKTDRYSDTPQGGLNGLNNTSGMENIEANTYLTNARIIDDTNNGNSTTEKGNIENNSKQNYNKRNENKDKNINESENEVENKNKQIGEESTNQNVKSKELKSNETTTKNSNASSNKTNDYFERRYGKNYSKSFAALLMEFRKTFLNIDLMIIEELENLFFGLW